MNENNGFDETWNERGLFVELDNNIKEMNYLALIGIGIFVIQTISVILTCKYGSSYLEAKERHRRQTGFLRPQHIDSMLQLTRSAVSTEKLSPSPSSSARKKTEMPKSIHSPTDSIAFKFSPGLLYQYHDRRLQPPSLDRLGKDEEKSHIYRMPNNENPNLSRIRSSEYFEYRGKNLLLSKKYGNEQIDYSKNSLL